MADKKDEKITDLKDIGSAVASDAKSDTKGEAPADNAEKASNTSCPANNTVSGLPKLLPLGCASPTPLINNLSPPVPG